MCIGGERQTQDGVVCDSKSNNFRRYETENDNSVKVTHLTLVK